MNRKLMAGLLGFVVAGLLLGSDFALAHPRQAIGPLPEFELSQTNFERDKEYPILIQNRSCPADKLDFSGAVLVISAGMSVVPNSLVTEPCAISAKIKISKDAPFGKFLLQVFNSSKTHVLGWAEGEVVAKIPGPIPPGLEQPQVDVMWEVMDPKSVEDTFGKRVRSRYYGIEVVIGNNSGYDLQIASVGFALPHTVLKTLKIQSERTGDGRIEWKLPSSGYRIVRAAIEKTQEVGARNRTFFLLDTLGGVAGGSIPFFRNVRPRSNFATIVSIFANPFINGLKQAFPDRTITQFTRLDDLALRNNYIVPNNTQDRKVVFFPKEILRTYFELKINEARERKQKNTGTDSSDFDYPLLQGKKPDEYPPLKVMEALGSLVLVGQEIKYLNRIRVVSENPGLESETKTAPQIKTTPDRFDQGEGVPPNAASDPTKDLKLEGVGLIKADPKAPAGITIKAGEVSSDRSSMNAKISVAETVAPGSYPIEVQTSAGPVKTSITVIRKPNPSSIEAKVNGTTLTVALLLDAAKTGKTVEFKIKGNSLLGGKLQFSDSKGKTIEQGISVSSESETELVLQWKPSKELGNLKESDLKGIYTLKITSEPNGKEGSTAFTL
ncbi:MAG: hypothetical protein K1Y36_20105 [Blastocatellia bacterium]|nr:hypothetical protein [Blastocatellia bacterium]